MNHAMEAKLKLLTRALRSARRSWVAVGAAALLMPATAHAAYVPPFDVPTATGKVDDNYVCTVSSTPVTTLVVDSRYVPGGAYDDIDPEAEAAYQAAMVQITRLLSDASTHANRFVRTNGVNVSGANCARTLLDNWAKADALSTVGGSAGWFKLSTTISGAALIFFQIKGTGGSSKTLIDSRIAYWLARRANELRSYRNTGDLGGTATNNHLYWAGLAIASVGAVTNDTVNFTWGMSALQTGACSVNSADLLPQELLRGTLALHYHVYSLLPLVTLAELAERNGLQGYTLCDSGIVRLAKKVLWMAPVPSRLESRAGTAQTAVMTEGEALPTPLWSWIIPYSRRYRIWSEWDARVDLSTRLASSEAGGDMRVLFPE